MGINNQMKKFNQMLLGEVFIVPIVTMKGITPKGASKSLQKLCQVCKNDDHDIDQCPKKNTRGRCRRQNVPINVVQAKTKERVQPP